MLPLLALVAARPSAPSFPLTVESIMRGYALVGHAPRGLQWSEDGKELRFSWAKADGTQNPPSKDYVVKSDGTGLALDTKSPTTLQYADSYRALRLSESKGDIFLSDLTKSTTKNLTNTPGRESAPVFVENGTAVAYEAGGNLYKVDLATGDTMKLTAIQGEKANPSQTALAAEEANLFKDIPPTRGGFRRGGRTPMPPPAKYTVPEGFIVGSLSASPNADFSIISLVKEAAGVRIAQVPNYITRSGYTEEISTYEKAGDDQTISRIAFLNIKEGTALDVPTPRPSNIRALHWAPNGRLGIFWADSLDHKDSWLIQFDTATRQVKTLWDEHDDAWVGGPGRGVLGWLPDGSRIYFQSENTGFAHVMTMASDGGDTTDLTQGKFEVSGLRLDAKRNRFIFTSTEGSPFMRQLCVVPFTGGARTKLADISADGDASYAIAPDGKTVAVVKSTSNHPSELFVNGVQVTETPTKEWLSGPWIKPPIVMVKARDGVDVPAHLYKPNNWKRGGPAVIFVHGAGYLQNVYEGWSYYYREYMFHHLLMSRGYAVLDMDYRGSAGYGKAWRTAIYRHMGGTDLTDDVDGAAYLVKELGVNRARIGIYGGSYGGFITLMAMFTTPGVFASGAALRPVSDWANYNHGYTTPILNNPQDDPLAYKQSSPIYFAEGLKGSLLICHGMIDTNVHYQDSVRLVQRLIDLGKKNWEIAPFPMEDHSFVRPESWTDEYGRILALFERTIGPGFGKKSLSY